MNAPLFSIVTVSFENIDGLRETTESLYAQSFTDFEHIVVDGGSTDGSADWLAANCRGTWLSEPDENNFDGMNKGARLSRGEYLWFMHSGDLFGDPDVLARVAAAIERAEHPEWLYGLARIVGPDKSLLGVLGVVPFSMFNVVILQRSLPHQASAFRRDFFWRLGGYDVKMGHASDQLFMVRAARCSPPLVLADMVCDFDFTGFSTRRSWWEHPWDGYRIRRMTGVKVTRWRALDNLLALGYTFLRFGGLFASGALRRANTTTKKSPEAGG